MELTAWHISISSSPTSQLQCSSRQTRYRDGPLARAIELQEDDALPRAHVEAWHSLVRAGASIIISYGARSAKTWLDACRDQV